MFFQVSDHNINNQVVAAMLLYLSAKRHPAKTVNPRASKCWNTKLLNVDSLLFLLCSTHLKWIKPGQVLSQSQCRSQSLKLTFKTVLLFRKSSFINSDTICQPELNYFIYVPVINFQLKGRLESGQSKSSGEKKASEQKGKTKLMYLSIWGTDS